MMTEQELIDHVSRIPDGEKHQAHGLSHAEVEELRLRQLHNLPIEMIPGNNGRADQINDPYFKAFIEENFSGQYQLPLHERGHFHVIMEPRLYDPASGQKLSIIVVQKYHGPAFNFQLENGGFNGFTVHILHFAEDLQTGQRIR